MSTCTIDAKFNLPIMIRQNPNSAVEMDKITNVVAMTSLSSSILSSKNSQLCYDTIATISGVTSLTNRRVIQNLADELQIDTYQVEDIILESSEFIFEFPELCLLE